MRSSANNAVVIYVGLFFLLGMGAWQPASADPFGTIITAGPNASLYDIDNNGVASNPRQLNYQSQITMTWAGLARSASAGTFFGLTYSQGSGTAYPQHIFLIANAATCSPVGTITGHIFGEGDCAREPSSGLIWGLDTNGQLYTMDAQNGNQTAIFVTTIQAPAGSHDFSALDFTSGGDLYAMDLAGGGHIYKVDKATGALLSSAALGTAVGTGNAAMSFAPNGTLYAIASVGGSQQLFTLNPTTGAVSNSHAISLGGTAITGFVANGTTSSGVAPVLTPFGAMALLAGLLGIAWLSIARKRRSTVSA
jgi:hypothetical protein